MMSAPVAAAASELSATNQKDITDSAKQIGKLGYVAFQSADTLTAAGGFHLA